MSGPTKQTQLNSTVVLTGLLFVFVLLRARWVGHVLAWDEAMTLNSMRTLASGSSDAFGAWFWRHPPLVTGLTGLLAPLTEGFAERVQWMSILFNTGAGVMLWLLNRAVFGPRIALLSLGFYAVFPGAVFFDTWCKGDPGVALFGVLAMLFVVQRRDVLAGVSLALAFMSKELAVFYALGIGVLLLFVERGMPLRRLIRVFLPSVIALGAWYGFLFFRPGTGLKLSLLEHVQFATKGGSSWLKSPFYYFQQMPLSLGIAGVILAVAGALLLTVKVTGKWRRGGSDARDLERRNATSYWPVFLLLPSYLVLSVFPSKVAWLTMSLFPAWATLCAVAVDAGVSWISRRWGTEAETRQAWVAGGALVACMLAIAVPGLGSTYEQMFEKVDESQWRGATRSFKNVQAVNATVEKDQRLLFTSFHYWKGMPPGFPCAVFTYYLRKDIPVLVRPHTAKIDQMLQDAARYEIDWLLLSPEPGEDEAAQFGTLVQGHKLTPIELEMARLFRLTPGTAVRTVSAGESAVPANN